MRENNLLKSIVCAALILILPATSLIPSAYASVIDLPKTGQTTTYYAGDDGALEIGVAWPTTGNSPSGRFNDNSDGTVTDLLTGLMWTKNANLGAGMVNFYTARNAVTALAIGGYTDWRIPNILELESLAHAGQSDTAVWLNTEGFTNVQSAEYWSNSAYAQTTTGWTFNLGTAQTNILVTWGVDWNAGSRYYLAVRGGAVGTPDPTYPANVRKTGASTSFTAADDGDLEWGVADPSPARFTDRGDGTIYDVLTGLQWTQQADLLTSTVYTTAIAYIAGMNSGANPNFGYTDWRMPNKKEMLTLTHMEDELSTDELTAAGFMNFGTCSFWTSTADPADPTRLYTIQLSYAGGEMLTWPEDSTGINCQIGWGQFPPNSILPVRTGIAICNDTLDNDSDGQTDFPADPGCSSASDDDEVDLINNPPTTPQLVSPANNDTGLDPARTELMWQPSTDPDGDTVFYNVFVCEDINFTVGCKTDTITASLESPDIYYAGINLDWKIVVFYIVVTLLISMLIKRRKTVLPVILLIAVLLVSSCGELQLVDEIAGLIGITGIDYPVVGLNGGTTYYWKIVANDGNGGLTSSAIWSFVTS